MTAIGLTKHSPGHDWKRRGSRTLRPATYAGKSRARTVRYLLAHVGFMYRSIGRIFRRRTIAAILLCALIPAATTIPSLAALALVSGICAAVVATAPATQFTGAARTGQGSPGT